MRTKITMRRLRMAVGKMALDLLNGRPWCRHRHLVRSRSDEKGPGYRCTDCLEWRRDTMAGPPRFTLTAPRIAPPPETGIQRMVNDRWADRVVTMGRRR
jgi:hypothetical protein